MSGGAGGAGAGGGTAMGQAQSRLHEPVAPPRINGLLLFLYTHPPTYSTVILHACSIH